MTREEQIKREYEEKLAALRNEQNNCKHDWADVVYDPEMKKEPYGYRPVHMGSDCWGEPEGYRDVKHDRWSRTCKKCGKVEYTTEQVAVKFEPKFK